jgi:cation diffusion facilitator family transporter
VGARDKRLAARRSLLAASFLTLLKVAVGLGSGSLGILSEAANSGLDILAAGFIYVTLWFSDKPADANHPYGHHKFESFAAFLQTGVVFFTCLTFVIAAFRRVFIAPAAVDVSISAVSVMVISIFVSWFRFHDLDRAARIHKSQALESHALNYRLDVWSALVVLLGLAALWLGQRWQLPSLRVADPIAALIVVGFVVYHSARLGRRTMDTLLDAAPAGLSERLLPAVEQVPGVVSCRRARVRYAGNKPFVDLKISVSRSIPFDHVPAILDRVRLEVEQLLPDADVVIDPEPDIPNEHSLFERVKWIARRNNLAVHDVLVHEVEGRLTLDLHLEVDERLTLDQAHDEANKLEQQVYAELSEIAVINTHIEGEGAHVQADRMPLAQREHMARELRRVATQVPDILDCHDVTVREISQKIYVSCHCLMLGSLPISQVHDRTVELETLFRNTFPEIYKVTIHTEPESERDVSARGNAGRSGHFR